MTKYFKIDRFLLSFCHIVKIIGDYLKSLSILAISYISSYRFLYRIGHFLTTISMYAENSEILCYEFKFKANICKKNIIKYRRLYLYLKLISKEITF